MNRERPTFIIVHPDDDAPEESSRHLGRPLDEALDQLGEVSPDEGFADDLEQVIESVGPAPTDPWTDA